MNIVRRSLIPVICVVTIADSSFTATLETAKNQGERDKEATVIYTNHLGSNTSTFIADQLADISGPIEETGGPNERITREEYRASQGGPQYSSHTAIVLLVNGYTVTAKDIQNSRTQALDSIRWMRDILSRIVTGEQVAEKLGNHFDWNSLIPETWEWRESLEADVTLTGNYGVNAVVLGGFVFRLTVLAEAVNAGHAPDLAEVDPLIAQMEADYAYGLAPVLNDAIRNCGRDNFFEQVLPESLTQQLTVQSWSEELIIASKSHEEGERIIRRAVRNAIDSVEVTITDAAVVGATPEQGIAYLKAYFALDPPPVKPACANGTAVANPRDNHGLADDCEAPLSAKDTLRPTGTLDWNTNMAIANWEEIITGGTLSRMKKWELSGKSFDGAIASEIGLLSES